jgi:hypothetical protein
MSLPGVLTGIAAVVTATGVLIGALQPVVTYLSGFFPSPVSPDPNRRRETVEVGTSPVEIDGISVRILRARQTTDNGAALVDLDYRVTTGADSAPHDPKSFVRLMVRGELKEPTWASATARVPPRSEEDFAVKFPAPSTLGHSVEFRFGEVSPRDVRVQLTR